MNVGIPVNPKQYEVSPGGKQTECAPAKQHAVILVVQLLLQVSHPHHAVHGQGVASYIILWSLIKMYACLYV